MTDKKFRWGIIGPGSIARQFASSLPYADAAEIVAVGSRSIERAESFAAEFGAEHAYDSYEKVAADPDVDAIYVATPHSGHRDAALLAISHGKPVLVEKPFAMNAAEAQEIVDAARSAGVFCMEAMWTRFFPVMGRLRELVGEGAIGAVKMVMADFGFRSSVNPSGRLYDTALGGGALMDVGIYPISFAWMLLGKPSQAIGAASVGETGVDEIAGMLLQYRGGELAVLSTAIRANTPLNAMVIGESGQIHVLPQWWRPSAILVKRDGREDETIEMPFPGRGFHFEANEVRRCVEAGKSESAILRHDDSIAMVAAMDELRRQFGVRYPSDRK